MTQKCVSYLFLFVAIQAFAIGYVYRGSFAPVADVLEDEFHTTSSGLGLASSMIYGAYAVMQIPYGLMITRIQPSFILLITFIGLSISSFLLTLTRNIIIVVILNGFSGIFIAPSFILAINMCIQYIGNPYVGLTVGVNMLHGNLYTLGFTTLQAYIYQLTNEWRYLYYFVSVYCLVCAVALFVLMLYDARSVLSRKQAMQSKPSTSYHALGSMEMVETTPIGAAENDQTPLIRNKSSFAMMTQKHVWNLMIFISDDQRRQHSNASQQELKLPLCTVLKAVVTNYLNYISGLFGFGIITVLFSFNGLWLISYLMIKFGYSRALASFVSGTFFISSGIGCVLYGQLCLKFKRRKPLMLSGVLCLLGSVYIIFCPSDTPMFVILIANNISGIGCGAITCVFSMLDEVNSYYKCTKVATGFVNTIVTCTGFVTQFLMGTLLDLHWTRRDGEVDEHGTRQYTVTDYDFAFNVIPSALLMAFVMAVITRETHSQPLDYSKTTKATAGQS